MPKPQLRAIGRVTQLLDGAQSVTIAALRAKVTWLEGQLREKIMMVAAQAELIAKLDARLVKEKG